MWFNVYLGFILIKGGVAKDESQLLYWSLVLQLLFKKNQKT